MTKSGKGVTFTQASKIDLAETTIPWVVVWKGKWYEQGEMGWWSMSPKKMLDKKWESEVKKMIGKLRKNTRVTMVDCHI